MLLASWRRRAGLSLALSSGRAPPAPSPSHSLHPHHPAHAPPPRPLQLATPRSAQSSRSALGIGIWGRKGIWGGKSQPPVSGGGGGGRKTHAGPGGGKMCLALPGRWGAPLPGQWRRAEGPLHVHVLALEVHQDDTEARVPCTGVQRSHVCQELYHPARLVLHWRRMGILNPPGPDLAVPCPGPVALPPSPQGLLDKAPPRPPPRNPRWLVGQPRARAPGTMKCTITSWRQARRSGRHSSGRPSGRTEAAGAGSGLSPSPSVSPARAPGRRRKTYSDRRSRRPPRSWSSSSRRKRLPRAESRRFSTFTMRRRAYRLRGGTQSAPSGSEAASTTPTRFFPQAAPSRRNEVATQVGCRTPPVPHHTSRPAGELPSQKAGPHSGAPSPWGSP